MVTKLTPTPGTAAAAAAAATHQNAYLPVPNPSQSYWRTPPHPLDSHRTTPSLPTACDVLIIGAGLAGVSVAYELSNLATTTTPPPSTVLLEARQTCSGATGRNGGHVKVKAATVFGMAARHGAAAADELVAFVRAQVAALKAVAEREGLAADCEFELRRSYDTFADARDAADMARRNPGLNVQTETPVLGVEKAEGEDGAPVTIVHTPRGSIAARKVVFATNAYTAGLLPQYRGIITPYKGTAAHLAALDGREPVYPHLSHTYNLHFERVKELETVDYLNPRPDGGIVVGGGKWLYEERRDLWYDTVDDSTLMGPIMKEKYFEGYMQRNFRGWDDSGSEAERVWTGIMGLTPDGVPHVGKVPGEQNQWILAGFNGGGNALIYLTAKAIARMVNDDSSFEEAGQGIPKLFKTTAERLGKR
ncbi:putative fad dependent oxidoreductase superfamily protein [Neofusicoccum parvum UCRNP2]|uniref:Putative fad dependent oxidoreductase superfamily protein n=1 Tax=Botryosphaeria parva (strain UCR-NP2) TaxID=1287680 RepID=R1EQU3_BOTPV|nr:putative fad dependent oxidoreductase superfamily protein [Neofusicoccum parvum UCRNP2]